MQAPARAPFPEYVNTRIGSKEWHAPMTLFTSGYMSRLLESHGCMVLEMAASNTIPSRYWGELENIASNPEATEVLIRLETEFSTKPGLLDMGTHLIVAARTPK